MREGFCTRPWGGTYFNGDGLHTLRATEADIAGNRAAAIIGGLRGVFFLISESDGYEVVAARKNARWCPSRACRDG